MCASSDLSRSCLGKLIEVEISAISPGSLAEKRREISQGLERDMGLRERPFLFLFCFFILGGSDLKMLKTCWEESS